MAIRVRLAQPAGGPEGGRPEQGLNMPINLAVFRWDEEHGDPARWRQLRRRWDLIHTGRVLLDSAGFALIAVAIVWQ